MSFSLLLQLQGPEILFTFSFFLYVDKKDTNVHFCIRTITVFCSYKKGIYIALQFAFLNLYVIHILPCKDILHKIS